MMGEAIFGAGAGESSGRENTEREFKFLINAKKDFKAFLPVSLAIGNGLLEKF